MPNLPITYNKFSKVFRIKKAEAQKACLICKKIILETTCLNEDCTHKKKIKPNLKYSDPLFINFDLIQHMKYVLEDKWMLIQECKRNLYKFSTLYSKYSIFLRI